jgi:hypothetical protein
VSQRLLLVHAAATLFMAGVIWFVQVVHYPLFAELGAALPHYAARNVRLTTWVVAGPMLVELVTAIVVAARPAPGGAAWLAWAGLALLAVIWVSTVVVQVPRHERLQAGDLDALRSLLASNWLRTGAWTLRAGIVLLLLDRRPA